MKTQKTAENAKKVETPKKGNSTTQSGKTTTEPTMKIVEKSNSKKEVPIVKLSADERIQNAEKFKILTNKFAHLKAKKNELEKFKISRDGTKEAVYFKNADDFELKVSNTSIVEQMLKLAESTLTNILTDTKKQVEEFVI